MTRDEARTLLRAGVSPEDIKKAHEAGVPASRLMEIAEARRKPTPEELGWTRDKARAMLQEGHTPADLKSAIGAGLTPDQVTLDALAHVDTSVKMQRPPLPFPFNMVMPRLGQDVGQAVDYFTGQGMAAALGDELASARDAAINWGKGLITGKDYPTYDELQAAREIRRNQYEEENPVLAPALKIGGALFGGGVPIRAAGIGSAATRLAAPLGQRAARTIGTGAELGALGGLFGAAEGVGSAPHSATLGETAERAGEGGLWGAAGGVALPAALQGGKAAWQAMRGTSSGLTPAQRAIVGNIQKGGTAGPGAAAKRMEMMGDEALLADVNEGTRAAAEMMMQALDSKKAVEGARKVIRRQARFWHRIRDAVRKDVTPTTTQAKLDQIDKIKAEKAEGLYRESYANPIDENHDNLEVMRAYMEKNPKVEKRAKDIWQADPLENRSWEEFREAGGTEYWHNIMKSASDLYQKSKGKNLKDAYSKAREIVRKALVDMNPKFGEAQQTWADVKTMEEALAAGRKLFKKGVSVDEIIADVNKYGPNEAAREAYKVGLAEDIIRQAGTVKIESGSVFNKLWGDPNTRQKLQAIFESKLELSDFVRTLNQEKQYHDTLKGIFNSRTFARLIQREQEAFAPLEQEIFQAMGETMWVGQNRAITNAFARFMAKLRHMGRGDAFKDEKAALLFGDKKEVIPRLREIQKTLETKHPWMASAFQEWAAKSLALATSGKKESDQRRAQQGSRHPDLRVIR